MEAREVIQGRDGRVRSAEVLLPGHTRISRAINCLYPLKMPICGKEADNKSLESSSKQEQEVNYETITGEKKARQAIFQSLMGSGAATIFFVSPRNVMNCMVIKLIDLIQAGLELLIIIMIYVFMCII